jgi:hypothetical protein
VQNDGIFFSLKGIISWNKIIFLLLCCIVDNFLIIAQKDFTTLGESLLILYEEWWGKGKAYLFIGQTGRYIQYIDCGASRATSDVFSVHARTCTVNAWALYVPYDIYGITHTSMKLSPNLRTPNPGINLGFTPPPFYITNAGRGNPGLNPRFGVLRCGPWTQSRGILTHNEPLEKQRLWNRQYMKGGQ